MYILFIFQPNFKAAFDLNNLYNQCKILDKKNNCTSKKISSCTKKEKSA